MVHLVAEALEDDEADMWASMIAKIAMMIALRRTDGSGGGPYRR
ncbi:hypothetical protein [Kribbella jiaozuonensis]|nr:hypothetical protein [Kribbella jiaozuonensis]